MTKEQYKLLAKLSMDAVYLSILKPELQKLQIDAELSRIEPQNEFDSVKITFKRLERIKTIDKIFNLIETAESQLDKMIK